MLPGKISLSGCNKTGLPLSDGPVLSGAEVHNIIPCDSKPFSVRGAKLKAKGHSLPINASGA